MTLTDGAALVLFFVAGLFMGMMDRNAHGKRGEAPGVTWKDKYKKDDKGNLKPVVNRWQHFWYLGLFRPQYVERFPFSATALVWLTDQWHGYKKLFLTTLFLAIALRPTITTWGALDAIILNADMLIGFNLFYHWKQIRPRK